MAMALVAGAAPVAHRRTHGRGSRAVLEQNANRKLTRRGGMIGAASGYDRKGAAIFEEAFMGGEHSKPQGPDLAQGVPLADIPDGGMVGGHGGDVLALQRPARRGAGRRRHGALSVAPRPFQPAHR